MSFNNLAKESSFSFGLVLLKNIDDKKFSRLVDRMMKDFEPNKVSFFTEHELTSMEKSLKLNTDQCQCLLNCLHCLLKEVISDVTKPVVLKNVLSELFSLDVNKVELFCECWTINAEKVVNKLHQKFTHSYKLIDANWALNISSNVGVELSDPEPRCLIELKLEDSNSYEECKIKNFFLDFNDEELNKFYQTLEAIKVELDVSPLKC